MKRGRYRRLIHCHATTPKIRPTTAVNTIASAPQKVTLIAPTVIDAPPTRAAVAPSAARNSKDKAATAGISCSPCTNQATAKGSAAPTVKAAAEENAA